MSFAGRHPTHSPVFVSQTGVGEAQSASAEHAGFAPPVPCPPVPLLCPPVPVDVLEVDVVDPEPEAPAPLFPPAFCELVVSAELPQAAASSMASDGTRIGVHRRAAENRFEGFCMRITPSWRSGFTCGRRPSRRRSSS